MRRLDTRKYWVDRGKTYIEEGRLGGQFYKDQEQFFLQAVRNEMPMAVMEVGCGFGRLTRVMAESMPQTDFRGVDLSKDQIENAREYCSGLPNVLFNQHDLFSLSFPYRTNVMVACEVLLHVPRIRIGMVVSKLVRASKVFIHDFDPKWPSGRPVGVHCFFHDYDRLYKADFDVKIEVEKQVSSDGKHGLYIVRRKG